MTEKQAILEVLDSEISKLTSMYEKRILKLERKILSLIDKNTKLEKSNTIRIEEGFNYAILNDNKNQEYDVLWHCLERLSNGLTYDLIDELCQSQSIDDAILLLSICEKLWTDLDIDMLRYVFNVLSHTQVVLFQKNKEVEVRFLNLIERMLVENKKSELTLEQLFSNFLDVLIVASKGPYKIQVTEFINKKHKLIFEDILLINDPTMIIKYIRMLIFYNLDIHVKNSLIHLLDVEWRFIEYHLSESEFVMFQWYAFLYDIDKRLIDDTLNQQRRFGKHTDELELYYSLYNDGEMDTYLYDQKVKKFMEGDSLKKYEKELIIRKIKQYNKAVEQLPLKMSREKITNQETVEIENSYSEEFILNEKSELRVLGYQITGLSRPERWNILMSAVPKLGLQRVVSIISYNIRLRKGQKNGEEKFEYAITEWNYDLEKLKNMYYNGGFNWPAQ